MEGHKTIIIPPTYPIQADKIIVCCPANAATGGPEILHQLVYTLRRLGHHAFISYYPFDEMHLCPEAYRKYDVPQMKFVDIGGTFIIVPEVATWILKHIKHADAAVWWLSVDNYFFAQHQSWLRDLIVRYKSLVRSRLPLRGLRRYRHFVQSHYAKKFLERYGIASLPLSDYLGAEHLILCGKSTPRRDIIVLNPKKGQKQTLRLHEANPDIEFVPIQNMTAIQVAVLLASAKLYIDFGHHPGKDRLPREAAMAGCCVITGRQGSAKYFKDVPIPEMYKLDDNSDAYIQAFRPLVNAIFLDYTSHALHFEQYREHILGEPAGFMRQVEFIFDAPAKSRSLTTG